MERAVVGLNQASLPEVVINGGVTVCSTLFHMEINYLDIAIGTSLFLSGLFALSLYQKQGKSRGWQMFPKMLMILGAFIAMFRLILSLIKVG